MSFRSQLDERAGRAGLALSDDVAGRLERYFELLRKWNEKISLTSLPLQTDIANAIDRLLIEPLAAAKCLPSSGILLDVGSGGGSPAIPLKIVSPGLALVMVESKTRKAAFLRDAARLLDLQNTRVEAVRLEELCVDASLREQVDVVTVRAVRSETALLQAIFGFLKPGARLLLFTSDTAPRTHTAGLDAQTGLTFHARHPLVAGTNSYLDELRRI